MSPGSYLTTFIKESSPRNGSKYVKNGDFLMPFKWGCGGQEVHDDGLLRFSSGNKGQENGFRLFELHLKYPQFFIVCCHFAVLTNMHPVGCALEL